jgi:hypothetical protein
MSSFPERIISAAALHELPIDILRLGREDEVGQPVHQVAVIGDAAEQDHGRMGVRIHEARRDRHPARPDHGLRRVLRIDLGRRSDGGDLPVADRHGTALDVRPGHGDDGSAGDEDVGALGGDCGSRSEDCCNEDGDARLHEHGARL